MRFQLRYLLRSPPCAIALRVGNHVEFLDVSAVRIHLQAGQHLAAFVIVAVTEFVAGRNRLHPDFLEELLVVVRARAADKQHGRLALAARLHHRARRLDRRHLLGDHLLDPRRQFGILKVFARFCAATSPMASAPMKFTFIHGMPNFFSIISAT